MLAGTLILRAQLEPRDNEGSLREQRPRVASLGPPQATGLTLKRASASPSDWRSLLQPPSPASALTEDCPPPRGPKAGGPDAPSVTDPATQRTAPSGPRDCGAREPWVLSLGRTRSVGVRGRLRPACPSMALCAARCWQHTVPRARAGVSSPQRRGVRPSTGRPCQKVNAGRGLQSLSAGRNKPNVPPEFA